MLPQIRISFQLTEITLTNVVLPDICKPTNVISISSFQNRRINQLKIRFTNANILNNKHGYAFNILNNCNSVDFIKLRSTSALTAVLCLHYMARKHNLT